MSDWNGGDGWVADLGGNEVRMAKLSELPAPSTAYAPTEIQPYQGSPGALGASTARIVWGEYWDEGDNNDLFGSPDLDTLLESMGLTVSSENDTFTVTRAGLFSASIVAIGKGGTVHDCALALQAPSMNDNPAVSIPSGAAADVNYNISFLWKAPEGETIRLVQIGTTGDEPLHSVGMVLVRLSG